MVKEKTTTEVKDKDPFASCKLRNGDFQPSDYLHLRYAAIIPEGIPFDVVKRPEYWSNVAQQLKQFDIIEVIAQDGAYYGELIVLSAQRTAAYMAQKSYLSLVEEEKIELSKDDPRAEFSVQYKGPSAKWCVIRLVDKEILKQDMTSKIEAMRWVDDYVKVLSA